MLLYTVACGRLPLANLDQICTKELDWSYADRNRIKLSPNFKQIVSLMLAKDHASRPAAKDLLRQPVFANAE